MREERERERETNIYIWFQWDTFNMYIHIGSLDGFCGYFIQLGYGDSRARQLK